MRVRTMVLSAVAVLAIAALPYIPGSPLAAFSAPEVLGSGRATAKAPSSAPAANASGAAAPTSPTPTVAVSTPVARPLIHAGPVTISSPGFWSWAGMAADFLRRAAERNQDPGTRRLHEISIMIRDSDNGAAEDIYQVNGSTASINRLISICGLTDSRATSGSWSKTYLSSRDAVRMGKCIADGRAAGGKWTSWLLTEMRNVRGYGRFGIISALPPDVAKTVAIKNGWLLRTDGLMRINCLAIGTDWVLAVLVRYAGSLGEAYGIGICKSVAAQLLKAP